MTHAWLITGPPGSGRSIAALCFFAAALQCAAESEDSRPWVWALPGVHHHDGRHPRRCATSHSRRAVHRGRRDARHRADRVAPPDHRAPADRGDRGRRPAHRGRGQCAAEGGRGAAGTGTVFLLCAPSVDPEDISVTLRSRCRHVASGDPRPSRRSRECWSTATAWTPTPRTRPPRSAAGTSGAPAGWPPRASKPGPAPGGGLGAGGDPGRQSGARL